MSRHVSDLLDVEEILPERHLGGVVAKDDLPKGEHYPSHVGERLDEVELPFGGEEKIGWYWLGWKITQ